MSVSKQIEAQKHTEDSVSHTGVEKKITWFVEVYEVHFIPYFQ